MPALCLEVGERALVGEGIVYTVFFNSVRCMRRVLQVERQYALELRQVRTSVGMAVYIARSDCALRTSD